MSTTCSISLSARFDVPTQRDMRERLVFEAGKLDPQTFDQPTVMPRALHISTATLNHLSNVCERAWAELSHAENTLLQHHYLWNKLGIPRRVQRLIARERDAHNTGTGCPAVRFCRFDLHPTPDGWRASEVNADVPGGFLEAGPITRIVASYINGVSCPPNPARGLATAIADTARTHHAPPLAAMIHATSYSDDQQVMRCIAAELEHVGIRAVDAAPDHILLLGNLVVHNLTREQVGCIVRFFPGEWLAHIRRRESLHALTAGTCIRCNPLRAMLVQSKRTPLVLRELGLQLPVWNELLPRTESVRRFNRLLIAEGKVLKPNWGRVGESVCVADATPRKTVRKASLSARLWPSHWVVQDRFNSAPLPTDEGPCHVCVGVYVINGKAAGLYARASRFAVIDHRAQDVAVVIDPSLDDHQPSTCPQIRTHTQEVPVGAT